MQVLIALLQLAPVVWALVKSAEEMWPQAKSGQEKLNLVLATVQAGYQASEPELKKVPWDKLLAGVTNMVAVAVNWFNSLGVFKKSE